MMLGEAGMRRKEQQQQQPQHQQQQGRASARYFTVTPSFQQSSATQHGGYPQQKKHQYQTSTPAAVAPMAAATAAVASTSAMMMIDEDEIESSASSFNLNRNRKYNSSGVNQQHQQQQQQYQYQHHEEDDDGEAVAGFHGASSSASIGHNSEEEEEEASSYDSGSLSAGNQRSRDFVKKSRGRRSLSRDRNGNNYQSSRSQHSPRQHHRSRERTVKAFSAASTTNADHYKSRDNFSAQPGENDNNGSKPDTRDDAEVNKLREWIQKNNTEVDELLNMIREKNQSIASAHTNWRGFSASDKEEFYEGKLAKYKTELVEDFNRLERHLENLKLERFERQKQLADLQNSIQKRDMIKKSDPISRAECFGEINRINAILAKAAKSEDVERLARWFDFEQKAETSQETKLEPSDRRQLVADLSRDLDDEGDENEEYYDPGPRTSNLSLYQRHHPPPGTSDYPSTANRSPEPPAIFHQPPELPSSVFDGNINYKGQLQEILMKEHVATPTYDLVRETGNFSAFIVEVKSGNFILGRGQGGTKKQAEQEASRVAIEKIEKDGLFLKL